MHIIENINRKLDKFPFTQYKYSLELNDHDYYFDISLDMANQPAIAKDELLVLLKEVVQAGTRRGSIHLTSITKKVFYDRADIDGNVDGIL